MCMRYLTPHKIRPCKIFQMAVFSRPVPGVLWHIYYFGCSSMLHQLIHKLFRRLKWMCYRRIYTENCSAGGLEKMHWKSLGHAVHSSPSVEKNETVMFSGVQQRARVLATIVHARPHTCFIARDLKQTLAVSQIAYYYNYNGFENKRGLFV